MAPSVPSGQRPARRPPARLRPLAPWHALSPGRAPRPRPGTATGRALRQVRLADALAAGALFAIIAAQFLLTRHPALGMRHPTPLAWLLSAALCAPILTHRRFPRASLATCLVALLAYSAGRYLAFPLLVVIVLTFDVTLHSDRMTGLVALVAAEVAVPVAVSLQPAPLSSAAVVAFCGVAIVVSWAVAESARLGRERVRWLRARAAQLERDQAEEARRAVTAERLRIARELHDMVAHSMSVIAVQSAVGNHVIDTQPAEARAALAAIEATSRSALTEMRRLLGVLRQEGEPPGALAPAPGLADLAALVGQVREAGLAAWVQVTGQPVPVPPAVDLSAYRVIQEALTNVIKHAAATPATITIGYAADAVTVEVRNEPPALAPAAAGPGQRPALAGAPGHGIIGMRERAAMFGGTLEAGPRPDGGFLVRARFPLAEVPR